MAATVIAAFNEFMKDTVNLKKAETDDKSASRDWLIGKINDFEKGDKFPVSYPAIHIAIGSFARRTKIRPLDDIYLMFGLSAQSATCNILSDRMGHPDLFSVRGRTYTGIDILELTLSAPSEFRMPLKAVGRALPSTPRLISGVIRKPLR
ncbi:hypothetical protein RKI04_24905 [Citrobacter amalonaticus]|uniref:hypothetical protein n=1 Tax=Citrobacter amalonaticus TaxID=35703 RepID=UPI00287B51CA|nr:hypothetical protein [Citrobacter amalonaticus]MDS4039463.1 hypothetical protein [Citrobacter amalonaticus]